MTRNICALHWLKILPTPSAQEISADLLSVRAPSAAAQGFVASCAAFEVESIPRDETRQARRARLGMEGLGVHSHGTMDKSKAADAKSRGNAAFQRQDYTLAAECYTEAISHDPTDSVLYSNRSAAYASLNEFTKALQDADKCVQLKGDWAKGHGRRGFALFHLGRLLEAHLAYNKALQIEPGNASLQERLHSVMCAGSLTQCFSSPREFLRYAQMACESGSVENIGSTIRRSADLRDRITNSLGGSIFQAAHADYLKLRCVACGKIAHKMAVCNGCNLARYCSSECQRTDWRARHKDDCKTATEYLTADWSQVQHSPAGVMYVMGWMGRPTFEETVVLSQKAIIKEMVKAGERIIFTSIWVRDLNQTRYCTMYVTCSTAAPSRPLCASEFTPHPDGKSVASYKYFSLTPVGPRGAAPRWRATTAPVSESLAAMEVMCRTLNEAFKTILVESDFTLVPEVSIGCRIELPAGARFWRKITCEASGFNGAAHCWWHFNPIIISVSKEALMRASRAVCGRRLEQLKVAADVFERTFLDRRGSNYLSRDMWGRHFKAVMDTQVAKAAIAGYCQANKGVRDRHVKSQLVKEALAFTDVFRMHSIEYAEDVQRRARGAVTQSEVLDDYTQAEVDGAKAELAALEPQYPPDIKAIIDAPAPQAS
ncbi:unnamed protein product [Vitrella brassicaformis CCMP3155]|uniref:Hsp70-Hsp90 organising protein n=1 Tax=Vitrella brassicaformis (strain CCMP3155) TaxID=1169540 RepID=A0A0G4FT72_VITBC|nr:unnamed protein product [Vitrella brassicaformis CCMP3155]|eukprot:CEM17824.1 unnamed protein product [Vitrella brassicaformis CCMP3155]